MENFPDKISPMTLAAAIALGSGGGGQPTGTVYYPAGSIPFLSLPALTLSRVGAVYDITDDFTSSSDFTDGGGKDYLAGTDVAIVNTGTAENPVLKYNCLTNAINEIVDQAKISASTTGSDLTLSTSSGGLNALTVYGKSEVVDGSIKSAGEGYATVDLGTLTWTYTTNQEQGWAVFVAPVPNIVSPSVAVDRLKGLLCPLYPISTKTPFSTMENKSMMRYNGNIVIKDNDYTDATAFKNSLNGILLCYELADPTQGNIIAVKTDNGSGIDGTMAVFTTGTPLYGISDSVRDVMQWDGSAGAVTKNCVKVKLADLTWHESVSQPGGFSVNVLNMPIGSYNLISTYSFNNRINFSWDSFGNYSDNTMFRNRANKFLYIKSTSYTNNLTGFVASLGDAELVYELVTPTTEQLTTAENASIAGLRTFEPTTHVQNNASATMTVEAYAGTGNGKAVADLKSELQITQSDTLTLTVADWTNNAQTIAYAHDTAKRNVIDVDPASVEEWASCGVLATAETANGITFACKTVPTNALNFKVTSMGGVIKCL